MKVKDFKFEFIPKENQERCQAIKQFIERHEWLGKMPTRPTHRFIASYKGILAGVIVMATPNSFSNLLGKENRHLEKLISRGACISWSPKNLGSALIMYSIRWMVQNTFFRVFTAYSDTEARELGTIYQACNFIYLGQSSGARLEYFDPLNPKRSWFSDRLFRKHSQIRRYAKELGISWEQEWSTRDRTHWDQIPNSVREQIKSQLRKHQARCKARGLPPKHKYVYILGRTKSETKHLKNLFAKHKPNLISLSYPKHRGPQANTAVNIITREEKILTTNILEVRPQIKEKEPSKFLTVKEAASVLKVSIWTIYKLIELDSTFPVQNIGVKKKWVVGEQDLSTWMEARTKRRILERQNLPTGLDLLKIGGE